MLQTTDIREGMTFIVAVVMVEVFFDGVIADYLVQTKINDAKIQVRDAIQSVSNVLVQLKTKEM